MLLIYINATNSDFDDEPQQLPQHEFIINNQINEKNDEIQPIRNLEEDDNDINDINTKYQYVCIVDAGSTGSRIHVYRYSKSSSSSSGLIEVDIEAEEYKKFYPGLSSFEDKSDDMEAMGEYLEDILNFGREHVPLSSRKSTPLFVLASAGMRKVRERNSKTAQNIIDLCYKYLSQSSEFIIPRDAVRIIEGSDEGLWGWIAANYLNGELLNLISIKNDDKMNDFYSLQTTKGVLEMGGESLQITFIPSETSLNSLKKHQHGINDKIHNIRTVKIADIEFYLFTYSWMGIGMEAAQNAYDRYLITKSLRETSPCYIMDDTHSRKNGVGKENEWNGSGNFDECYSDLSDMIDETLKNKKCSIPLEEVEDMMCTPNGILMPKIADLSVIPNNLQFYYIENFYYTAKVLNILNIHGIEFLSKMRQSGQSYCSLNKDDAIKEYPDASSDEISKTCFCSAWLLAMLNRGFNLQNFDKFSVIRDINGKGAIDWALGYLVAQVPNINLNEEYEYQHQQQQKSEPSYTFRFLLMLMVIFGMIYCWKSGIKNSNNPSLNKYNQTKTWLYKKFGLMNNTKNSNSQIQYHYQRLNMRRSV